MIKFNIDDTNDKNEKEKVVIWKQVLKVPLYIIL